ncbi:MAG: type II secretion system protein GspG [Myxococcaceae bacterium]
MSAWDKIAVGALLFVVCDTLTAVSAVKYLEHHAYKKADAARLDISQLQVAVDAYYARNARYPEQLAVLVDAGTLRLTNDPWGNPYVYTLVNGAPVIASYGADGKPGGEGRDADLTNQERR